MSTGTIQIGTRGVFTLIIVLVAISETVGAENILGAFLAGVLVSLLSPNPDLVHKLRFVWLWIFNSNILCHDRCKFGYLVIIKEAKLITSYSFFVNWHC